MKTKLLALIVSMSLCISQAFTAEERDAATIEQLRKLGDNPDKKHSIEFFFYGTSNSSIDCLKRELGKEFINSTSSKTVGTFSRSMKISLEEMQSLRKKFERAATECKVRYDGWGTEVEK